MLEFRNIGDKVRKNHFNCKQLLQPHHSITPSFRYSNWNEVPKFKPYYKLISFSEIFFILFCIASLFLLAVPVMMTWLCLPLLTISMHTL
jgi:hypothetical protein